MKNIVIVLMSVGLVQAQEPFQGLYNGQIGLYNAQVRTKLGGLAPVTASPYSAVAVTENVQALADGNRIVQKHSEKLYRDGQGRERSENADGTEAVITDPVAKTSYTLNSQARTARQSSSPFFNLKNLKLTLAPDQAAAEAERVAREAQLTALAAQLAAQQAARVAALEAAGVKPTDAAGRGGRGGDPATAAAPLAGGRGGGRGGPSAGGPNAGGRGPAPANPNSVTENLTPGNIEGVYATGTRTTRTIPAGQVGNEREIKVVDEVWYSPDLQMNVLTKHSDPRMGENTYRLTNISRAEPDASLFQVPAGYTVVGLRETPFGAKEQPSKATK